jgi:aminoglycoside phosphotransferase (APT) family kinase protein
VRPDRLAHYLSVLSGDGHPVRNSAATLASGQFHDVVLTADVVYRFPRDEDSRRRLPERAALLTALASRAVPVTIPAPLDATHLDRPVGSCYLAVRRVHGDPAVPGPVSEPARNRLASQLARLLDDLARLGLDSAVRQAVPAVGPQWWLDWGARVRRELFPLMSELGRQRADGELAAVATLAASGEALVHSDLGGANLLLAGSADGPVLTGVLDWDEACIGNQASDLASLAVTFGWAVAERIDAARQAEGTAPPMTGSARLIAATFALQQALPAALSGDQESLDDGLSGYR